jgi:hypothetical protein
MCLAPDPQLLLDSAKDECISHTNGNEHKMILKGDLWFTFAVGLEAVAFLSQ